MTTGLDDELRDWLRAVPVSDQQLRQLRNFQLPARRPPSLLRNWAPAAAVLVLLIGIVLILVSRAPSVGPTVQADGPVAIQTRAPNDVCEAARVSGTLVPDPTYGLGLQRSGRTSGAIWPFGYSAQRVSGKVVLIGPSGAIVAREGNSIVASGAAGPDGTVEVECDIQVGSGASPSAAADAPTSAPISAAASPTSAVRCIRQGTTALRGVVAARPSGWVDLGETAALSDFPSTAGRVYGPDGAAAPPDEGPGRLALYETFPVSDAYLQSRIERSRSGGGTPVAVSICGEATDVWQNQATGELVVGWTDRDKSDVLVGNAADFTVQELVDAAESVYDCCG
jgi:hypothetical protein